MNQKQFWSDVDIFWLDFVFVKPHAVLPVFCLNMQTDCYNAHPRHVADELPDHLVISKQRHGWLSLAQTG